MAENKKKSVAEKLILFAVFLVFAGIVVTFAFRWNYVDTDTASKEVTSFQFATSSKTDTVAHSSSDAASSDDSSSAGSSGSDSSGDDSSGTDSSNTGSSDATVIGKININTATVEELDALPGIGEKKAQAIVDYRETESVFTAPEDVMNVSGIGEKIFEQIKDHIVVE